MYPYLGRKTFVKGMTGEVEGMLCGISFIVFVIVVLIYVGIMVHDLRTLWSGVSFWGMLACLVLLLFFTVSEYSAQLASSGWIIGILVALFIAVVLCVLALPGFMVLMFCVEGIKVIRREGMKLSTCYPCFLRFYCMGIWLSGPGSGI